MIWILAFPSVNANFGLSFANFGLSFANFGLSFMNFILMENIKPLEEVYTGINGIRYKHIYFFAKCITDKLPSINPDNFAQTTEIGGIGWFVYKDAMKKIRPYHREKINVVRKSFIMMRAKNKYFDEFLLNDF